MIETATNDPIRNEQNLRYSRFLNHFRNILANRQLGFKRSF